MDFAILNALYQWAKLNPAIAGIIAGLWLAGVWWRGLPEADRKALEVRYPRPVGLLRVVLGLLPDPWVIVRALGFSVIAGKPHPGSVVEPRPQALAEIVEIMEARAAMQDEVPPVIVGDESPK